MVRPFLPNPCFRLTGMGTFADSEDFHRSNEHAAFSDCQIRNAPIVKLVKMLWGLIGFFPVQFELTDKFCGQFLFICSMPNTQTPNYEWSRIGDLVKL